VVASALNVMSAAVHIARTLHAAGLVAQLEDHGKNALSAVVSVVFTGKPYRLTVEPDYGPNAANVVYLPWALGEPRESPPQEPLKRHDDAYYMPCWACGDALGDGKPVRLIAIGADTNDERVRLGAGLKASVPHAMVHDECATGISPALEAAVIE